MDSPQSLEFVNDFAMRIDSIAADPAQERFVRGFLTRAVQNCPLDALKEIASCVLSMRRRELLDVSRQN